MCPVNPLLFLTQPLIPFIMQYQPTNVFSDNLTNLQYCKANFCLWFIVVVVGPQTIERAGMDGSLCSAATFS